MMVKTYKAPSMMEALQMIQEELGPDAIVVSAREETGGSGWGIKKTRGVEIVAMSADEAARARQQTAKTVLRPSPDGKSVEFLEQTPPIEWEDEASIGAVDPSSKRWQPVYLRKQDITMHPSDGAPTSDQATPRTLRKGEPESSLKPSTAEAPSTETSLAVSEPRSLQKIRHQLRAQGVDEAFVDLLIHRAAQTLNPGALLTDETCARHISSALAAELRVQPGPLPRGKRVIFLVGASGSGKTSVAAKLAVLFSQRFNKKTAWISADTVHIGAIGEARSYTDALGLPLRLVYTPAELRSAVETESNAEFILVDTPGINPFRENQIAELGAFLTEIPQRFTYLVAPATTKEGDLVQLMASLSVLRLDGLIVTRLDETCSFGSVYNLARRTQLPLSYFTTGKEITGCLEVATTDKLVTALFSKGEFK